MNRLSLEALRFPCAPPRPRPTIVPTLPPPGTILPRFRYRAMVGPGKPLELRSLGDVSATQAFVEGAFQKCLDMPDPAKWPELLEAFSRDPATLVQVKNAISYSQAAATRYNLFAAAG